MTGFERVVNLKHVIVIPYEDNSELRYIQDIYTYYFADHGLPEIKRWELLDGEYLEKHFNFPTIENARYLGICIPKTVSISTVNGIINDDDLGGYARLLTNP